MSSTSSVETTTYRIWSYETGQVLGEYEAETPFDAIEALHRDAGYESTEAAARALGTTPYALRSALVCETVMVDAPEEAT